MAAGATYTPIATTTLGSAQSSVTFSSLGSYTDIFLRVTATNDTPATSNMQLRFNGDTGTNYSYTRLLGNGSSASSSNGANQTAMAFAYYADDPNDFGVMEANIQNFSNTTTYKPVISRGSVATVMVSAYVGTWRSTAAITSITILNSSGVNFKAGSTFTIWGIQAA